MDDDIIDNDDDDDMVDDVDATNPSISNDGTTLDMRMHIYSMKGTLNRCCSGCSCCDDRLYRQLWGNSDAII